MKKAKPKIVHYKRKMRKEYLVWRNEDGSRCDYYFKTLRAALKFLGQSAKDGFTDMEFFVVYL